MENTRCRGKGNSEMMTPYAKRTLDSTSYHTPEERPRVPGSRFDSRVLLWKIILHMELKINNMTCKNLPKFRSGGTKIEVWRSRIESWRGSGRLLGGSWLQDASQTPSEGILGGSWAVLGASWWRTWLQQGPQNEAKIQ